MELPSFTTSPNDIQQGGRATGTLHRNEIWWRDQYYDLKRNGYGLRPRYHPDWVPSWRGSDKDFFAVEDGQPSIVSALSLVLSMLTVSISRELRWMLHDDAMPSTSCSRRFYPRKGHTSSKLHSSFRPQRTLEILATIVYHCSTLLKSPTLARS